jgi:hypothetical protein
MFVTLLGMVIEVSDVQSQKVATPMRVVLLGKLIVSKFLEKGEMLLVGDYNVVISTDSFMTPLSE